MVDSLWKRACLTGGDSGWGIDRVRESNGCADVDVWRKSTSNYAPYGQEIRSDKFSKLERFRFTCWNCEIVQGGFFFEEEAAQRPGFCKEQNRKRCSRGLLAMAS